MDLQSINYLLSGEGIILLIMTLVQIAPIKINPWTWIVKKAGKLIHEELIGNLDVKIDKLERNIEDLRLECEEREITLCRTHILRFGDEILHGTKHSKEHFEQILRDITMYQNYCHIHPAYLNNVADATIDKVLQTYKECLDKNSFL